MSPANRPSKPYQDARPGKPATKDSVAEDLVRSWSPEMRARVRAVTVKDLEDGSAVAGEEATYLDLIALIDKVNEEEAA